MCTKQASQRRRFCTATDRSTEPTALAGLLCTQRTTFTKISIFSQHFLFRSLFSLVTTVQFNPYPSPRPPCMAEAPLSPPRTHSGISVPWSKICRTGQTIVPPDQLHYLYIYMWDVQFYIYKFRPFGLCVYCTVLMCFL